MSPNLAVEAPCVTRIPAGQIGLFYGFLPVLSFVAGAICLLPGAELVIVVSFFRNGCWTCSARRGNYQLRDELVTRHSMNLLARLAATSLLFSCSAAGAVQLLYDFNYDLGVGVVTGQFIADEEEAFGAGGNGYAAIISFTFDFLGVTFDLLDTNVNGAPDTVLRPSAAVALSASPR